MINVSLVFSFIIVALMSGVNVGAGGDLQTDISVQMERKNDTFLSRRRRYLMFPEGSSFQLVFCLTYSSVGVGSYFVFGHTAALAYELPSTPLYFDQRDFQSKEEDEAETTTTEMPEVFDVSKLNHFHSENERVSYDNSPWRVPDKNLQQKFSRNNFNRPSYYTNALEGPYSYNFWKYGKPQFSFNSNSNSHTFRKYSTKTNRNENGYGHNPSFRYDSQKSHMSFKMEPKYHEVHRKTRRDLYKKLESFLTTVNVDGKACVLKAICEIRKSPRKDMKGTFVEEMFKAVFKSKPHDDDKDEDDYDAATNPEYSCTDMFKTCQGSIRNIHLLTRK